MGLYTQFFGDALNPFVVLLNCNLANIQIQFWHEREMQNLEGLNNRLLVKIPPNPTPALALHSGLGNSYSHSKTSTFNLG